jgi:hypothetical protein
MEDETLEYVDVLEADVDTYCDFMSDCLGYPDEEEYADAE